MRNSYLSYYRQLSANIKMKIKTSVCNSAEATKHYANKTVTNFMIFHFNIREKNVCYTLLYMIFQYG